MQTRIRKKLSDRNSASTKVEQTQSQPQSRSFGDSSQSTEEVSPTSSEKSIGYNFGQIEVQPATPRVIQPKPIIGGSSSRTEGGDRIGKQSLTQTKAALQLTPIQQPLIQKQPETEIGVPTWDPKAEEGKGAFVDSTIPTKIYLDIVTSKNVTDAKYNHYKNKKEYKYKTGSGEVEDGRLFKNNVNQSKLTRDPNQSILGNGKIDWLKLENYTKTATLEDIARLDPQSEIVKNILKYPLKQSWHLAKEYLALSDSETRQALMRKLWEFRQWHYIEILKKAQTKLNNIYPEGLTAWPSAGSTSLTSDIDVNLKGKKTEYAVEVFNQTFKEDGFDFESGVVYDVNVYALDFMHAFQGVDVGGHKLTGKEGKRTAIKQGGFVFEPNQEKDIKEQEEWSLVKLRLYMTEKEWKDYKVKVSLSNNIAESVENKYKNYQKELNEEMQKQAGVKVKNTSSDNNSSSGINQINDLADQLAKNSKKPENAKIIAQIPQKNKQANQSVILTQMQREQQKFAQKLNALEKDCHLLQKDKEENQQVKAEDYKIAASNRIYEKKLNDVAVVRFQVQREIKKYEKLKTAISAGQVSTQTRFQMALQNQIIESKLQELRKIVSEAALYSNEAYITDGAVNHAVVGLQGGNAIEQNKAELMNAVTENLADALKEIARHGSSLGEAAYKAAKYYMRMADAAKNMGYGQQGEKIDLVERLYKAGYDISVSLKNQDGLSEEQKQKESEKYICNHLGINKNIVSLKEKIMEVGIKIKQKFSELKEKDKLALGKQAPAGKGVISHN